jgi:hypothetical protein
MTMKNDKRWWLASPFVYVLPTIHLCVCITIALANIESGWEHMIKVDFPFSILLTALTWRLEHPIVWFGILGTFWWYALSWMFWVVLSGEWRRRFN